MRALKILVVVMGVMLIAGIVALGVGISYRVNHRAAPALLAVPTAIPPHGMPRSVELPAGAKILGVQSDGDRVMVRLGLTDGGEELMLLDWRTGARLATFDLRAAKN
jgi:hypothetical protein